MANTYTVNKGDTLWGIAKRFLGSGSKYPTLAKINNIKNPNYIVVGQVIKLSSSGTKATTAKKTASTASTSSSAGKAVINVFGLQADTDRTVYATWTWSKSNTENYQTIWYYDTGNGVWFVGNDSTTTDKQSIYNAPSNAKKVKFKVKPISKKHTVNKKSTSYWTASWSAEKTYNFSNNPPTAPSAPSVTLKDFTLTAELDNLDVNATVIQFQVVKDDATVFKTGNANIVTSHASFSCTVTAGSEYKVRARSVRGSIYSDWSDYSSNVGTKPAAPGGITLIRANSETSIYLEWSAVKNAKTYSIEYANKITYFYNSDATSTVSGIEFNHYEKTGLESGQEYFFRVRADNDNGSSAWTGIKSVIIGKPPAAPTTWSSATTVIVGEPLTLYWVHNAEDGSSETYAELELIFDGEKQTKTIKKSTDEKEKDKTSAYPIDTSKYKEGSKIEWRVRTSGITKAYGDWSIQRTINLYAPPTLELSVTNKDGQNLEVLESFPFYVKGVPGPNTQSPIGYQLVVKSNSYYETVDNTGNRKVVNTGDEVYSRYFDIDEPLLAELSANNIDLENNVDYTVVCTVSMDSGLTAESSVIFSVLWTDEQYSPNAEISLDNELYVSYIRPYCEFYPIEYHKVIKEGELYIKTDEIIDSETEGTSFDDVFTETDEMVFKVDSEEESYFCMVESDVGELVEDVTLSVYRREFDGGFTEIASGLSNTSNTFVTDPHPSLDYARYRIVAITNSTGAVSYYDVPGYPVNEPCIIIQWEEEWSNFNTVSEDIPEKPPWSGSLLKLPFNIQTSEQNSSDVEHVEYIGRKHPVSYYGTQVGETQSWSTDVDKEDKDTLYALRRLQRWMGDVYVREPSGSGYWATISISFSQNYKELVIPVSISITRVEGGA